MEKICQSCAMPLNSKELIGTNKDGSKNEDYCVYCYKDGEYTESNITMEEMADVCVGYMKREGMSEDEARKIMDDCLPNLKRWKK